MGISDYALDTFVSQEMSKITRLELESLVAEFPNADAWLVEFVMSRIFQAQVPKEKAALLYTIIRRAHAAMQEWELACAAALGNMRHVGVYFRVLRHLENCISSTWQGLEFTRKAVKAELFTKGEGNVYERLNWIYNTSRHFNPEALPEGDLHKVWLSDKALHTREHAVQFTELRETVSFLANMSEKVIRQLSGKP